MTDEENQKRRQALDNLAALGQEFEEHRKQYEAECDEYWGNLSYEDQLKAFYSVCKRIHQGDIKDHGSYRYVLYDVFDFGPDAYGVGMDCGYMAIHNAIFDGVEFVDEEKL